VIDDREPVTPGDVTEAVGCALAALTPPAAADWSVPARELEWSCWETMEHVADALLAYALQLGPQQRPVDHYVPLRWSRERPGAPGGVIFGDPAAGPAGLLEAVAATGGLLAAAVTVSGPQVRALHGYGVSDPEGFAAMGVVETLVHGFDVAGGLGVTLRPPAGLCARALARLFPEVPAGADPWAALLWATGRIDLAERGTGRRLFETWHSAPLPEAGQEAASEVASEAASEVAS
jgi:hypothetical protein